MTDVTFDFEPYDVLVAGEQFGEIRDAFIRLGISAVSCDLDPDRTGTGPHFQGNWVYGEGKPRHDERIAAVEYTESRWNMVKQHSDYAALENPQGVLPKMSKSMGQTGCWVQPYEHGDDASKKTGFHLWNLPPILPEPDKYVEPRWVCCGEVLDVKTVGKYGCPNCHGDKKPLPRWANQTDSGQNRLGPSEDRARQRAATYPGIAAVVARVWGDHVFGERPRSALEDLL